VIIWIDAQLSPALAAWLTEIFALDAHAVRDLGLREAADRAIFLAARSASVVVMTKDSDFVRLLEEFGPPPQIIWLTCGNTSNTHLKQILMKALPQAIILLESGEPLVEVR
jgi:predicted nuclease of predicted toxin-antitoxin system